jgi:hypothetical protein
LLIVRVGFENKGYEELGASTSRMGKPGKTNRVGPYRYT